MLRSVLAELFPNLLRRKVVRERSSGSLTALQSLQRRIDMANKTKPQIRKPAPPPPRSTKADPDRKDAAGEPWKPPPVRDVREDPSPNPDGHPDAKAK